MSAPFGLRRRLTTSPHFFWCLTTYHQNLPPSRSVGVAPPLFWWSLHFSLSLVRWSLVVRRSSFVVRPEMKILQKLKHKNIVDLVEMITDKEESKADRRRQEAKGELYKFVIIF